MRLLITADLHFNNQRSRPLAEKLISNMNAAGGDVLLIIGDTAAADGDALEQCLSLFNFKGPKLFVAGNHELWTAIGDSHAIYTQILPKRIESLGWQWLATRPFVADKCTIVGSMGWYDYRFAATRLEIPTRFYAEKISPGAAERFPEMSHLFLSPEDPSPRSRQIVARWNDGRYVRLGKSDPEFLEELLETLAGQLDASTRDHPTRPIIAAIHHLPLAELLPPSHADQRDFGKAFLGSDRIGALLLRYPAVTRVFCGHSHYAAEAKVGPIHAVNIGSGYGDKRFLAIDIE
jgi:Icc-related predicted phosphoesterase